MLHTHFRRNPERPEQLELILGAHDRFRFLSRLKLEFFHKALLDLHLCQQNEPTTVVDSTHSLPLSFDLCVDDGAPGLLPANQTERVPVRLQRARRTERVAPLSKRPVEETVHHFGRHTCERLGWIEAQNLAETRK